MQRALQRTGPAWPVRALASARSRLLLTVFLLSLVIPLAIHLGPVRLTAYRVVLILTVLPALVHLILDKTNRLTLADLLIACAFGWAALACYVTPGTRDPLEAAGVLLLESCGAYLLARVTIRSAEDFRHMIRLLFWVVAAVLPFSIIESQTGTSPLLQLAAKVGQTFPQIYQDQRLGLHRVQSIFEHSITYGVFCATILGGYYYLNVLGRREGWRRFSIIPVSTFLSVSAGGYLIVTVQTALMLWDRLTRRILHRWYLLGLAAASGFALLSLYAAKSPFHIIVFRLSFSSQSGYTRILIWEHGTAEVASHPLFGLGLEIEKWSRPDWMGPSIDNFWLFLTMSYGVPMIVAFLAAIVLLFWRTARARLPAGDDARVRMGYLVTLVGFLVAGMTVHYWNAMFVWFMFFLGSGAYLSHSTR